MARNRGRADEFCSHGERVAVCSAGVSDAARDAEGVSEGGQADQVGGDARDNRDGGVDGPGANDVGGSAIADSPRGTDVPSQEGQSSVDVY